MDAPRDDLIRFVPVESRASVAADGRTMTGYPIVFDTWTEIHGYEGDFKERIAPGALAKTLRESGKNVKILFNHGMDPQIGDKPLGKPSVMRTDEHGLYVEVPISDTSYGNDLLALMRDGAIDGQSFRFSVVKEDWVKPKRGLPERTITELKLMELGPVTFPAYEATTVGVRSRESFDEWRNLTDDKRDEIRRILADPSDDLSTPDPEAVHLDTPEGESRDETPDEPASRHSEASHKPSVLNRDWLRAQARSAGALDHEED